MQYLSFFALVVLALPFVPAQFAAGPSAVMAEPSVLESGPAPGATLPMAFEPNVGQTDERVRFLARGKGYAVFLTQDGATLSLAGRSNATPKVEEPGAGGRQPGARTVREAVALRIAGARPGRLVPERAMSGTVNYLRGSDPEAWRQDVPTYAAVRYEGVYEGVDAVFYGTQSALEYDFVLAPGADPSQIRVRFEGQRSVEVDEAGDLVLRLEGGEVRQQRAVVYQGDGAARVRVPARYALGADGEVRFELDAYDPARSLVIDPVIVYAGYLGGARGYDSTSAVALDASGAVYVAGATQSSDFPVTAGSYDQTRNNSHEWVDVFVAKVSADGSEILAATYLGGRYDEYADDIEVDASGRVFVVGHTDSSNFPVTAGAYDTSFGGSTDIFVAELDATLSSLTYSTFIGGQNAEYARSASFAAGSLYLAGAAYTGDFPTTPGAFDTTHNGGSQDAFVMKWSVSNWTLGYSTFLGGEALDWAYAVGVDASGSAVVAGEVRSTQYPTTEGAFDRSLAGTSDAFVTKLTPDGSALAYSTYLGGSSFESAYALGVDGQGAVYVGGQTLSSNFPTTAGAYDVTSNGTWDGFVTKVSLDGSALAYSTLLGGGATDGVRAVAVDGAGAVYMACGTASTDFPTSAGAFDTQFDPAGDGVVAKLAPGGATLAYSTYLGGSGEDGIVSLAVDASGAAVVVGTSSSADYPLLNAASTRPSDLSEGTITKIAPTGGSLVFSTLIGGHLGASSDSASDVKVDASGAVYVVGTTASRDFPTTPGGYDATVSDWDVYVSKIAPGGTSLVYSTFVGGSRTENDPALALGPQGDVVIVGTTNSTNYPVTPGAYDTTQPGPFDSSELFATKLNAAGNGLVFSTYLGGTSSEFTPDVGLDAAGNVLVAAMTFSTNYPTTAGAYDTTSNGSGDLVITKLRADGAALLYSTYVGGANRESSPTIAVDASGAAYVAAATSSSDYPTTPGAPDSIAGGHDDACVLKLTPDGSALVYSTYLGGTFPDRSEGIAVDTAGSVYVTGVTSSPDFPTTPGAYDTSPSGGFDAFVTKLDAAGVALAFSSLLGSGGSTNGRDIVVGPDGSAYVAGMTTYAGYPTTPDAVFPAYGGGARDAVVSRLSPDGSTLVFSTFAGGSGDDEGVALDVRDGGDVYLVGGTTSADFATGGFGVDDGGNAFVLRIDLLPGVGTDTPGVQSASTGAWFLRNANSPGGADAVFGYGPAGLGWTALAGDWDGDDVDTPGLYDPSNGFFFLRNANSPGPADAFFGFGPGGLGWKPIAGDWDGDGDDTIGLYDPSSGFFYIRNENAPGGADSFFGFGPGGLGWVPITGDWDGDGDDTVGLYDPSSGFFYLRNENAPGGADSVFGFGPGGLGWRPLAGDWDGNGNDTIGLYDPSAGFFYLRQENAPGPADAFFGYGPTGVAPLVGNWDGQ